MKAVWLASLAFTAFTALAGCSKLWGDDPDLCGNEVISRGDAPDGGHSAVVFQRNCGATTSYSTQVSILDTRSALAGGGNVFVADHGGPVSSWAWGGPWVDFEWRSPRRLVIKYDGDARVFKNDSSVGGVSISYEAVTK